VKTKKGTEENLQEDSEHSQPGDSQPLRNIICYQQVLQAGRIPGYVLLPLI